MKRKFISFTDKEVNILADVLKIRSDLEDLKMMINGCDINEIRQMNLRFNNNTYEIFYNGNFYQLYFRNYKCIDVSCLCPSK